jgi:transcription initiation factor TFIID subunit 9B
MLDSASKIYQHHLKKHLLSMASRTNATPLPPLSESYGVRLPPQKYCLTGVDFDLVPNKPPQSEMDISMDGSKGAGDEDGDEDDEDEDEDGEEQGGEGEDSTMDLFGLDAAVRMDEEEAGGGGNEWNGSGEEENDDNEALFEDDAEDGDEEMPAAAATSETNGAQVGEKRKLNPEDEDYD